MIRITSVTISDVERFVNEVYNKLPDYEPGTEGTDYKGRYHEIKPLDVIINTNIGEIDVSCVIEMSGVLQQVMRETHDHPSESRYTRNDNLYNIVIYNEDGEIEIDNIRDIIREFNKKLSCKQRDDII